MQRLQVRNGLPLAAVLTLGSVASAQGFNIDIGNPAFGVPSFQYGAAADQAGVWNPLGSPHTGALVAIDGSSTSVQINVAGGVGDLHFNNTLTVGDEDALYDDFKDLGNQDQTTTIQFTGLADGEYDVYTYAMAPDSPVYYTGVTVIGAAGGMQIVGGDYPGDHLLGTTFAQHTVDVTGGTLVLEVTDIAGYGSLNGIQLVPGDEPPPAEPGSNYCFSAMNSTGGSAWMSAAGTNSLSANDLVLSANEVPNHPGYGIFIAGPGQAMTPKYNGFLCVSPNGLQRIVQITPPVGNTVTQAIDYTGATTGTEPLNIIPGFNYYFQHWFRDPAAGGANANFSDGYVIQFAP